MPAEQVGHVFHPEGPDAGQPVERCFMPPRRGGSAGFGCPETCRALEHYVHPYQGSGERITLAFNSLVEELMPLP